MMENIGIKGSTLSIESLKGFEDQVIMSDEKITVAFINNPAVLSKNDRVMLYFNDDLIFYGYFDGSFTASIPEGVSDREIVHFNLKIARIDSSKKQVTYYSIQNKSVCYWNNKFKYLYIGFFPNNDETNRINFFPQEHTVIQ
ncbi:MAG: hypothetical protein ACOCQ4_03465 [bacterium]